MCANALMDFSISRWFSVSCFFLKFWLCALGQLRGEISFQRQSRETRLGTTDRTASGVSALAAGKIRVTQLHWLLQAPLQGLLHNWIHFEEVLGSTWMRYGELHCALYSHHFSALLSLSLSERQLYGRTAVMLKALSHAFGTKLSRNDTMSLKNRQFYSARFFIF